MKLDRIEASEKDWSEQSRTHNHGRKMSGKERAGDDGKWYNEDSRRDTEG